MTVEWMKVTVSDIASPTRNALVGGPFGSNLVSKDYAEQGVPVIRGQNMVGRWVGGQFAFVSEEKAATLGANTARPGDLIFTQRGTLGQVSLVPAGPFERYVVSQSQMKLTVNPKIADSVFYYYVFLSEEQQNHIRQHAIQTGVPHTNLGILRDTPVPLPPLSDQRAIAHILGLFDDKIELNRRMSETIEELALAIFKSWFVDFDPVRMKMAGRKPVGMDAETVALFPADFVDAVPRGWRTCVLGDVCENFDSRRVPLSGAERAKRQGRFPYHGAAGVLDNVDDYLFEGVHLLVGEDGSVVDVAGRAVRQYVWGQFWVNNHAHVLRGIGSVTTEWLYLYFGIARVGSIVTGAVQPKITQGNLNRLPVILPPPPVLRAFTDRVDTWFALRRQNDEESRTLIAYRDALLPKLLSGELRIEEAESFLHGGA